ncbi:MAG TPA: HNH endonuclease signature motif containing protein [Anaeromyxobacteraceae bacterium]
MHDTRDLTTRLAELLHREHAALADFLIALADFDRERRWVELGHTSLFYFLHRELGLSKGAAFYRKTAAELVHRYPEVIEPLRQGKLCITSVVELAKVITPENRSEVLPRFFHASKGEAKAVAAELRPAEAAPHRDVVTVLQLAAKATARVEVPTADHAPLGAAVRLDELRGEVRATPPYPQPPAPIPAARPDEVEPLTGDLRRYHFTVSKRFLAKLAAARDALSHSHPGADTEAVLEAALDLLLAANDKKKGLVKKPRAAPARPPASPRYIPAEVKRAVWTRDGKCCRWPLASGGVCGCTTRLELDHIVPLARGGLPW